MRITAVAVLAFSIVATGTAAAGVDGPVRAPWDWISSERIELRTNPAMIERLRIRSDASAMFVLRIEGRTHPELLLPTELFRNLLSGLGGQPEGRAILQQAYAPVVARLNLPEDFLNELMGISAKYLGREMRIRHLNGELASLTGLDREQLRAERDSLAPLQCAALYEALSTARQQYGLARFDRFLYEAVAPGMVVTMTEPDRREQLIQWERGCK